MLNVVIGSIFGIVLFCLALPYTWEGLLMLKRFIDDINDEDDRRYGI